MAVSRIKKGNDFRGVDGSIYEDFGTNGTITSQHDGWWAVTWEETSTSPLAIAYMYQDGKEIASTSGVGYRTGLCTTAAPVKAGLTYNIITYRGAIKSSRVYY